MLVKRMFTPVTILCSGSTTAVLQQKDDLPLPYRELIQPQDAGRGGLSGASSPDYIGAFSVTCDVPKPPQHLLLGPHGAPIPSRYRLLTQMAAKTLAVAPPGTTDGVWLSEHLTTTQTAEAPPLKHQKHGLVPQPLIIQYHLQLTSSYGIIRPLGCR